MNKHLKRLNEIRARQEEILATVKAEQREMTEAEQAEWNGLREERQVLNMEIEILRNGPRVQEESRAVALEQFVKEARKQGRSAEFTLRAVMDYTTTGPQAGVIPLTIGDVWQPVEKGLILDKVGIRLQTGLVGDYVWPIITSGVECTVEDENAEVADTTIPMSKLKPEPKRLAIAVPVSNTLIDMSAGVIWQVVQSQVPLAVIRTLNKCAFGGGGLKLKGLMDDANIPKATITTTGPTWSEMLGLPAAVASKGYSLETACFVMNNAMKYRLKAQPKDAGSGLFVCDADDRIDGMPVFTTEYMPADKILFGNFSYFLQGQFGETRITIDPLTGAKKNLTYIILNTNYSQSVVASDAFVVGQAAGA